MNDTVYSLEVALQQFEEIRISLDVKKSCKNFSLLNFAIGDCPVSVQWDLSLSGLKYALHFIENHHTQQFVEDYMYKQVHLMTSQK